MSWLDFDRDGDVDGMDFALGGMFLGFLHDSEEADKKSALADAGLDEFDLQTMSNSERRAALREAGLDPYDF